MHTAFPTQTSKLQNCVGQGHARDRDDAVNDIEEDGVHAHVSIEEDGAHAQVSEQATSDYHRLLREPTDLAAIVCFFTLWVGQRRQAKPSILHLVWDRKRHSWSDHSPWS